MNRFKKKVMIKELVELIKFIYLFTMTKNILQGRYLWLSHFYKSTHYLYKKMISLSIGNLLDARS